MSDLSDIERKIIEPIIDRTLKAGLVISVYDGEEYALNFSTDKAEILKVTGATDETTYWFCDGVTYLGHVHLVHGNDEDVVSDCTDIPRILAIVGDLLSEEG